MKKVFFFTLIAVMFVLLTPSSVDSSAAICRSGVTDGVCCSQYSSDYRWPSGTGMCCGGQPYYGATYCPSSDASCAAVTCTSSCTNIAGTGGIANTNGWCVDGSCDFYQLPCDNLDQCSGDDFINYGCGGGNCNAAAPQSCSTCNCPNEAGVQQKCGGYNTAESPQNDNCFDGKDNDCDGTCDTGGCNSGTLPPDPKCGIKIEYLSDIQAKCQYFPNSHTYYCSDKLDWNPSGSASIQEASGPVITNYSLATFTENSTTGSFTGTNPITVTAGGTCAPINVNASITGICEGSNYKSGDCVKLPEVTATRGYFQKHVITSGGCTYRLCSWSGCSGSASFNTGESCGFSANGAGYWDFICCYVSACYASGGSCSVASYINQENLPANCNWGSQTYYTPCAVNPSISVNGMFFQYLGMVRNTTSVNLPLDNFKVGSNTLQMSAQESRKFDYTLRWNEANSPVPCVGSKRTKAYHITSGNVLQSGDNARIIQGDFTMMFDSASRTTEIALLKDDSNAVASARIIPFDANNLKLEIYNSTGWTLVTNNIQPKKWYMFRITLNENLNTVLISIESPEYPTISSSFNIPVASPAIKWISISSNGGWLDDVNITKKDLAGTIISKYAEDFESRDFGDSVLYNGDDPLYNIYVTKDITIDPYPVTYGCSYNNQICTVPMIGKNIVLKAVTNVEAKTISSGYGTGPDYSSWVAGSVGNIEINAKNIKFDNLLSDCPGVGEPGDSWCGGGSITLKGDVINGNIVRSYGAYDCSKNTGGCYSYLCWGGGVGSVSITANSTNLNYIYLNSAGASFPASGGRANIFSENVNIKEIRTDGASDLSGGSGGAVTIKGARINVSTINANGGSASGNAYCTGGRAGSGGPINIVAKESVNITSILASGGSGEHAGGGGSIRVSTTNISAPMKLTANGASGGVFSGTSGNGNAYEYATPGSAGGTVNIYADHIASEVNVSITGGNAVGMSYFTGFSTGCELGSAGVGGIAAIFSDNQITGDLNINNKGGGGADYRNQWTNNCQILGGGDGGLIIRQRTWGGFVGMNASVLDLTYNSYLIKVKDLWTNQYVKQRNESYSDYYYNKTFNNSMDSGIMVKRIINALIGFPGKNPPFRPSFEMALGKDYQLEITASPCNPFDEDLCSHDNDRTYIVPIVEY